MRPLPELKDTERMARVGRLAVLNKERRRCAEKLRDAMVPIINHTGQVSDMDAVYELVESIKTIDELISKESQHDHAK